LSSASFDLTSRSGLLDSVSTGINTALRGAELEQRVADLEAANARPERPDTDDARYMGGQYL